MVGLTGSAGTPGEEGAVGPRGQIGRDAEYCLCSAVDDSNCLIQARARLEAKINAATAAEGAPLATCRARAPPPTTIDVELSSRRAKIFLSSCSFILEQSARHF